MSYTNSADIYLGDISSQVYEFIRQPKPCLFFNLDRIAWREHGGFAHWHLGQVVERLTDLPSSLRQSSAEQPPLTRKAVGEEKRVAEGVYLGGRCSSKKK